ncbi:hypothetical protein FNF27_07038 [Cafeteria roenbergensis]|uniref:Uncharacterized protein n=1 Tax=Cafeteria roenbergensis TaxID=33653 RepID=A0A5A8C2I1_CAFRO|nr:hypothetical protein FNF29_07471 [Cafeteria roenbergensis]KAA0169219.1 hypothetical protein FNF27_07038 [Cafeteria roenbergensis]|eukprot:KAA0147302.1 hypothetical protein FNF29_07471 [Cafeteria roenbergensis]
MAMEIHDDAVPGEVAGNIMMAPEAERLVEGLEALPLLEYGTDKWVDQHHALERLNAQAHVNARNRSDPFVLEALITFDKLPTVVQMLVTAEAWIDRVFPRLEGRLPDDRSMRAYYMLYHEALLINLLECLLYHESAAEALGDGVACVGILRYLAEHASSLSLAGVVRMVETHDLVLALVPLLENPPWVRRRQSPPPRTGDASAAPAGGASHAAAPGAASWEKLIDNRWTAVAAPDLLKLSQPEAQAWLALHMLLSHEEVRKRWPMHSYRKTTLMRVRRYLNPVLLDQLPPLAGLQRFLDESSVMDAPSATSEGLGRRVLLEASPELTEAVIAGATGLPAVRQRAAAIIRERPAAAAAQGPGPGQGSDEPDPVALATDEEKDEALWAAVAEASAEACLAVADRASAALKRLAGLYEEDSYAGLADGATAVAAAGAAPLSSDDEAAVLAAAEAALQGAKAPPSQTAAAADRVPAPAPAPTARPKRAMIEVVDEMD